MLRLELGAVTKSMEPLTAASYLLGLREPRELDGLEQLVLEHLGNVENLLAHIRRMKLAPVESEFKLAR